MNLQCLTVIAFAMTAVARHIHIWQEMHLNLDQTITLTSLTTTAFDVKAESTSFITARFGFLGLREQITDRGKHTGISRRV